MTRPPTDATQWECDTCGQWNPIQVVACRKCKKGMNNNVRAYQLVNSLTPAEEMFYAGTSPEILREMKDITAALRTIIREIKTWMSAGQ